MRSRISPTGLFLAGFFAVLGAGLLLAEPPTSPKESSDPPKATAPAARARPIPTVDFQIPWMGQKILAMHSETNKPILGRPTVPDADLRYFYLPLFAFSRNGSGELEVTVSDDGQITLPIIYDNDVVRKAVRKYLTAEKLISPNATDGQVMTVAARMWCLQTSPGYEPRVTFGPYENYQFGMKDLLHTRLAPDLAKKFIRDLQTGDVSLQATIVFEGYSYQDNVVVVTADDILSTDQYKKLSGAGGKGLVGRHQVARIAREACLTRTIAVTTEYEDPDFADLVKTLAATFAQKESKPVADWDKVEAFFKDVGWDPADFKADLIESAKRNENREFRDQFSKDIQSNFGASASGGYGPFSASASVQTSSGRKVVTDVFQKWGIQTEWTGKQFIPRSIDLYALNAASVRQATAFAVGKRKKTVSDGVLTVGVNPNNALHMKATPAYEERLANLAHEVGQMPKVAVRDYIISYKNTGKGDPRWSREGNTITVDPGYHVTIPLSETYGTKVLGAFMVVTQSNEQIPLYTLLAEWKGSSEYGEDLKAGQVGIRTRYFDRPGAVIVRLFVVYQE